MKRPVIIIAIIVIAAALYFTFKPGASSADPEYVKQIEKSLRETSKGDIPEQLIPCIAQELASKTSKEDYKIISDYVQKNNSLANGPESPLVVKDFTFASIESTISCAENDDSLTDEFKKEVEQVKSFLPMIKAMMYGG